MSFSLKKDKHGVVVVGVLVSLSKKIREQGGDLRLCGLNEDLQTLFELTKLDTLFAITKTSEEALAAF